MNVLAPDEPQLVSRQQTGRLHGWAMIAVLAVGFGLGSAALSAPGPQRRLAAVLNLGAFLSGRTAATMNSVMAHDLPIGGFLQAVGGVLRWRVFGAGGPQVAVGCNDWLYLTEELRPWPDAGAAMQARADALHRVKAGLEAQGIALQVVLVPDKARIADAHLCHAPHSAQSGARYAAFMALLGGLSVVDLHSVFATAREQIYYRTDTHWNEAGAALAARSVAAAVTTVVGHDATFQTAALPVADRVGDLLRLMSLDAVPDLVLKLRPLPDREAPEATLRTDSPAATGGLLDDPVVPDIVLVGSSYSVNANFHGRLQEALHAPVGQFAEVGGGFWSSARDYFRSPAFRETPPKLVIWEIPERVTNQPITAEEAAFLGNWAGG